MTPARHYTAQSLRDAPTEAKIPRPATVQRVAPGTYVVTGVAVDGRPMTKPSRTMTVRHEPAEPWRLVIDGEQHSLHRTLRLARYAASAAEFGVRP